MTVDAHDWENSESKLNEVQTKIEELDKKLKAGGMDMANLLRGQIEQFDQERAAITKSTAATVDGILTNQKIKAAMSIINRCLDLETSPDAMSGQLELTDGVKKLEHGAAQYLYDQFTKDLPNPVHMGCYSNPETVRKVNISDLAKAAESESQQNGKSMAENAAAMMTNTSEFELADKWQDITDDDVQKQFSKIPASYGPHTYEPPLPPDNDAEPIELISVHEARDRGVCRVCKGQANARRIGNQVDPLVLDYGAEYAHRSCLNWLRAQPLSTRPTVRFQRVICRAHEIAVKLGDEWAGIEHLALAMCEEPRDCVTHVALDELDQHNPAFGFVQWKSAILHKLGKEGKL